MATRFADKVEKKEVRPGQFVITDSRFRMPAEGETDLQKVWATRFQKAERMVERGRVFGFTLRVHNHKDK